MELKRIQKQEKIQEPLKQKYKNRINSSKGITIVALVITIVLMLILAGTTISLTMRGDGIFSQALQAREKYKISEYEDRVELARASVSVNNMGKVAIDNLIEQIYKEEIVERGSITKLDEERAKMQTKEGYVFIITADKIEYEGKGEEYETPPEIQEGDIIFRINPEEWTNGNVKVGITNNVVEQFILKYSYNGTEWINYTEELEIENNRIIYACLENKLGEKSNASSCAITKIDKLEPVQFLPDITSTTNSITIDASEAKDAEGNEKYGQSGIKEIWYSKDAGTTWETNEEDKTNTEYTFTELTQGQEYNIQVKVIDNAGNQTITETQAVTTTTVTGLTVTVGNADTWTNGTKNITITASNNNYSTIRYTLDGSMPTTSSTAYTKAFTVDKNCTITAVAFDSTNQAGVSATNEVTRIDKLAPTGSVSVSTTTNSAKVTVSATDQAKTSTSGKSEIKGYYYSKDGGSNYTAITTQTSYTFTNLAQSSNVNIRVKVVDNAGNETVLSPTGNVTTGTVAGLTVTVGNADTWTNGTKNITITASNNNYSTIRYTLDGSMPTTSSTAYTKAFTVDKNCIITAVAFDSTNQAGVSATNEVTRIDKLAPTGSISVSTTTNSAKVTVSATDQAKTSTSGKSEIKGYYYSKDGGSNYTAITTQTSYTFTNLAQSSNVNIRVKVVDNAGNETVLSPTGNVTTGTVAGLTVTVGNADTWTNGTKTITITASNNNYSTIRYTLDGSMPTTSSTAYTGAFTVSSNCTITAVAYDSTNQAGVSATNEVTRIDKTAPSTPTITYNSGSNACVWQTGINISLYSTDSQSQVAYYEVDWDGDGVANTTTGENFIPWNGYHSCNNRFRAVDNVGNYSNWSDAVHIHIDTTTPTVPIITYNSGSNACSWQNNISITLSSIGGTSGIAYYEIDYTGDGVADTTTGANFIPGNGYSSCNNRFRAVNHSGLRSEWSSAIHVHQDTEAPTHVNWWYGQVDTDLITLYVQASDNVGIQRIQCPTSTATGSYNNWVWIDTVWDASANAYRADIYPSTWGHFNTTYLTHLYMYDHAGNGGSYSQTTANIGNVVAQVGNTYYSSVAKAIAAIPSSGTITMLTNSTENVTIPSGKNITLNMNSKTITGNLVNNGTLTVSGGTLTASSGYTVLNNSSMSIISSTIKLTSQNTALMNLGTINVTGGSISSGGYGLVNRGGVASIRNATITGGSSYSVQNETGSWSTLINCTTRDLVNTANPGSGGVWLINTSSTVDTYQPVVSIELDGDKLGLYLYSGSEYPNVRFATWSAANGQDDIQWYSAPTQGLNGSSYANTGARLSSHSNYASGLIIHVFLNQTSTFYGEAVLKEW